MRYNACLPVPENCAWSAKRVRNESEGKGASAVSIARRSWSVAAACVVALEATILLLLLKHESRPKCPEDFYYSYRTVLVAGGCCSREDMLPADKEVSVQE